ncbi:TRAP transporter substrate-binding protein [Acidimangrovimonas sediminis]|uniref:TRAP transporter substrate-binding protein n=1 Tax=Acidimangrovimonas sediminis TaxID=2056283 RepID=UPI000C7FEF5E|nr:TRAP transporter substrate-binding protein [Acidimangrovimonas sediminis]
MTREAMSRRGFLQTSGFAVAGATGLATLGLPRHALAAGTTLRYGHMNSPTSINGQQAVWFSEAVKTASGGEVDIQVFPSSQLGSIKELAEGVSTGAVPISHNTAGALAPLYAPIAALDTPYLYRDVDHLMKVVDTASPVMEGINKGLIEKAGVRVLYAFYFGTRQLSANVAAKSPTDLKGVKIRAIPSPIYLTTVEGLGAVPVPVDWSEVPTALATGVVSGQENPVNVVLDNKLYEVQSHLMLTGHIRAAELVVMNEDQYQMLSPKAKEAIAEAADTVRARASKATLDAEASDLAALKDKGMTVIGPDSGLDLAAFKTSVKALVEKKFGDQYGDLYKQIAAVS